MVCFQSLLIPYSCTTNEYTDEYNKTASHKDRGAGFSTLIIAIISTELKIASDFFQAIADFLGPKYEESKQVASDYAQKAQETAEHYVQVGQEKAGEYQKVAEQKGEQAKQEAHKTKEQAKQEAHKTKEEAKKQT